jgi:hypothetical protein
MNDETAMTHRERLLACLAGRLPDGVPVAPDFSNMIPARCVGLVNHA